LARQSAIEVLESLGCGPQIFQPGVAGVAVDVIERQARRKHWPSGEKPDEVVEKLPLPASHAAIFVAGCVSALPVAAHIPTPDVPVNLRAEALVNDVLH